MSDFHQIGPVTALPRLLERPVEDLEREILALTSKFRVSLVIPMIPSELDRPALAVGLGSQEIVRHWLAKYFEGEGKHKDDAGIRHW